MEIFAIGSTVEIGNGIAATVIAFSICETGTRYQCVWWDKFTRYEVWLAACEVKESLSDGRKRTIGFRASEPR